MNQAISQKVDLIILGAAGELLQPQLKAAKKAGIPVVALHLYDKVQPKPPNVTAFTLAPFALGGKLEADWVIADSKGKANVLIINFSDQPPTKYVLAAIKREFSKYCGSGCKTSSITLAATDMGTKLQPAVQSALIKDPSINYVFPLYDSATQFVLPAIQQARRVGKVKTAAYNGTPFVLKYMQDGDVVGMDVGESIDWIGYEAMDQALRILTGHKPVSGYTTPVRVWVKSNVNQAGDPPAINTGYGTSYVRGYKKLWGVK
jgi:ribose transport system substrate-binding protein